MLVKECQEFLVIRKQKQWILQSTHFCLIVIGFSGVRFVWSLSQIHGVLYGGLNFC